MRHGQSGLRTALIWAGVALGVTLPLIAAVTSPLLAWRSGIYIASGFTGIFAMGLLLLQPLLATNALPGLHPMRARRVHRGIGALLVAAVVAHVVGLWITSPPDVVDALLLSSPTPFSIWGVTAMWAVFCAAALAVFRRHLRLSMWRVLHMSVAILIVATTIAHVALIDGTMEIVTKIGLSLLVGAATARMVYLKLPRRD
ncbi:ferric reductase-like transmembrane domain-containing protein [uncultured Tateyamaria sp.]|uniref:ferric reductase-like transmembrane domain-containing protein n=1 Tax=uncultured Tateyamaria sp. TaxID=455651 RepID=UPI0026372B23|nr:ferric reductase-like transmembrane domain-containing protein [uncultured Tateyamaria sp.]